MLPFGTPPALGVGHPLQFGTPPAVWNSTRRMTYPSTANHMLSQSYDGHLTAFAPAAYPIQQDNDVAENNNDDDDV